MSSFPFLFAFVVGGLGFLFCVFVTGWRHALQSGLLLLLNHSFNNNLILLLLLGHSARQLKLKNACQCDFELISIILASHSLTV